MKKILSAVFVLTFSLAATAGGGQPQPTVQGLLRTVLQECDGATDAAQLTPGCRAAVAEYKARIPAETAKIRQMDLAQINRALPVYCGGDPWGTSPLCHELIQRYQALEYKARIPAETAKIRQMDLAQIDRAQSEYCEKDPWGTSPLCRELIQRYQTLEEAEVGSLLKDKTRLRREYQACTDKILPLRAQAEAARKRYFEQGEKDADQQEWFARSDQARQIAATYPCREVKKALQHAGGSENAGSEW